MANLPVKDCPICGEKLVRQSVQDARGVTPDWYCQIICEVQDDGEKWLYNHYRESAVIDYSTIIVLPYKIINSCGQAKVGIRTRYLTGSRKYYFKTILKCATILPTSEEKMVNRIKLALVMS